jgi:acyl CoA:acetate/3-ketoacid CoA transferase beta subunit
MNINAKNAMPAGTIIMGQIIAEESEIQKMTPILLDFDTAVDLGISPVIVDYFREKAQNYLKAPSKILSMGELNQWAKEKSILQNSTKVLY